MTEGNTTTFVCNICNAKASTKYIAERHFKIVHSAENPYQCNVCPKKFAFKWMLEDHQEIHNTHYMKCVICSKDIRSAKMKTHIKSACRHTGGLGARAPQNDLHSIRMLCIRMHA